MFVLQRSWGSAWQTGVSLKAATGAPFTPVTSARYDAADGVWVPGYGAPFGERLPAYARLDVSASYLTTLGRDQLTVLFVSISNLLGRENVSGWQYSPDYSDRSPAGQGFARTLYFGVSTSFGS